MIRNFGQNVIFSPKHYYEPKSESEVLDILNRHKHGTIRTQGSLHAWSDAVASDDVFLNLKNISSVHVIKEDGVTRVV
ncbi:MAG TPA: hypothetical protein VEC17_00795, partial [Candidatus Binatia bacterium]|nr:hypothetical protein [Candidatus Binatia bacterium]